ncbi:MAG: hypothetical protein ACREPB_13425 [Arenimonas sp.]
MNTKTEVSDDAPSPLFSYQGAYLSLFGADISIGPFTIELEPPVKLGIGYAVAYQELDSVPVTTVRTATIKSHVEDKPSNVVQAGFIQNGTEWLMTFSIQTDPKGGLEGTDFALDVQSNYPQIPMSIERTPINQAGFGALTKGTLPADYWAQLTLRYWNNGKTDLPLDAWVTVQVAYVKAPKSQHNAIDSLVGIPLVTTGEVLFFPTPGSGDSPVLGNNYPDKERYKKPRIL